MRSRRAFTVIELIVAIAVAAIVTAAVTSSISQLGRAREVARLRMNACRRATDALENIRRDVQSVLRSDDLFNTRFRLAAESVRTAAGEMDRDQMLLFNERLRPTRALEYSGEGQEYEAQYRIETDGDGTVLWRRRDAVPDQYEDAGGVAEPVGEGVVGLRLEAYDGKSWRQDWDSDTDGLPWAVRATVTASGARAGEDVMQDTRALVTMQTEIPVDRVEPPKKEEEPAPTSGTEDPGATGTSGDMSGAGGVGGAGGDVAGGPGGGGASGGGKGGKGNGGEFINAGGGRGAGRGAGGRGAGAGGGARGGSVPFIPPPSQNGPRGGGQGGGRGGPS